MTSGTITARPKARGGTEEMFPSRVTHVHSPRVFGLDFLRALAIGAVVVAHGFSFLMPHLPWWCGFIGHSGFYGVELFFALSGFLIGSLLIRVGPALAQPDRLVTFYIRRWFRTLPLFWLFIGFQILLELGLRQRHLSYSEIIEHAFFLRNFNALEITFFPESWSLAIEEWFYLLFPALLWLGLRVVSRFNIAFLSVVAIFFLFSTIARMIEAPHAYAHWPDWQRELVILRFDALMIGVFAAWISVNYARVWYRSRWVVAALGVIILFAMYATLWRITDHHLEWSADSYFARTFRFNPVSLGFAMLLPVASSWQLAREIFASTAVRRIALWSYALYLVHFPVFQIVAKCTPARWTSSFAQGIAVTALQFAAVIGISALLYRYYESRCTHLRERVAPAVARLLRKR
jgi:peptidoglycan/LPS O-acetylase OafA/YrhL